MMAQVPETRGRYLPRTLKVPQWARSKWPGKLAAGCWKGKALPSNNVQTFREGLMMSKAELARKAGLSTLTIDRVEAGRPCRLDTKRKILLALGLKVSDKDQIFAPQLDAPESVTAHHQEVHAIHGPAAHASGGSSASHESVASVADAGPHDGKGEATR